MFFASKYLGFFLSFVVISVSAMDRRDGAPFIDVFRPTPGIQLRFFAAGPITGKDSEALKQQKLPVLFLTGMGGFLEEYAHVSETLRSQGRKVYGLEWRGQGGSSRVPGRVHTDSFDYYIQDLHTFVEQKIEETRFDIFALSMGAHIALRYAAEGGSRRINSIAAISPMVRMITPVPFWVSQIVANAACFLGGSQWYALGQGPYDVDESCQRMRTKSLITEGELEKYRGAVERNLDKVPGGVTWGWVAAAMQSVGSLLSSDISVRTMIFQTPRDAVVDVGSYPELIERMEHDVVTVSLDAPHDMFFGGDEILKEIIGRFEDFSRNQYLSFQKMQNFKRFLFVWKLLKLHSALKQPSKPQVSSEQ